VSNIADISGTDSKPVVAYKYSAVQTQNLRGWVCRKRSLVHEPHFGLRGVIDVLCGQFTGSERLL